MRFGVDSRSEVSVVDREGEAHTTASVSGGARPPQTLDSEALVAEVQRLELELKRYRSHAERTSKLFQSVTRYAEWIRERAREDAELALRKARAKVQKLDAMAHDLERTELELVAARDELERLQRLTVETRARLAAFLTSGLDALSTAEATEQGDSAAPAPRDLTDTLQEHLTLASRSTAGGLAKESADSTAERPRGT